MIKVKLIPRISTKLAKSN